MSGTMVVEFVASPLGMRYASTDQDAAFFPSIWSSAM